MMRYNLSKKLNVAISMKTKSICWDWKALEDICFYLSVKYRLASPFVRRYSGEDISKATLLGSGESTSTVLH
ncbi:hypothetical protein YC2023_016863 [Brassica napus]